MVATTRSGYRRFLSRSRDESPRKHTIQRNRFCDRKSQIPRNDPHRNDCFHHRNRVCNYGTSLSSSIHHGPLIQIQLCKNLFLFPLIFQKLPQRSFPRQLLLRLTPAIDCPCYTWSTQPSSQRPTTSPQSTSRENYRKE